MKRYIINIRGAVASGKTTALKQYMDRFGYSVETVETPSGKIPISVLHDTSVVVIGDYCAGGNCHGADRLNILSDIVDCIIAIYEKYDPKIIMYEHMITSTIFKGTYETAQIVREFGYEFIAVQFRLSEEKRLKNLLNRSGDKASMKRFYSNNGKKIDSAAEKLISAGITTLRIDVDNIPKENMWKVIEYAIRKKVK